MLQITPQHKVYLAIEAVDFRRGIDGLAGMCESLFKKAPNSGAVFLFTNKRKNAVKVLVYDGIGYWLCLKRLSQGKLQWWPKSSDEYTSIDVTSLQIMLYKGNPEYAKITPPWRDVSS